MPLEAVAKVQFDRSACVDRKSLEHFFPPGALFPGERAAELHEFLRSWYSRILSRMEGPSLSCGSSDIETYRFLMIPTWGQPTAVRVVFRADGAVLTADRLSGQGGYDPGRLETSVRRVLFRTERELLRREVMRAGFWRMLVRDPDHFGVDGTQWILEGRFADRYHVVDRWSPRTGQFHELGALFARLGGVPLR
ncbi:MAG: hypothetical protein SFV15_00015 [Polyangiaceae bacterium]|nr:hypothetical protein [Polyangiaceae bacterium]